MRFGVGVVRFLAVSFGFGDAFESCVAAVLQALVGVPSGFAALLMDVVRSDVVDIGAVVGFAPGGDVLVETEGGFLAGAFWDIGSAVEDVNGGVVGEALLGDEVLDDQ